MAEKRPDRRLADAVAAFNAGDARAALRLAKQVLGRDRKNAVALEVAGIAAAGLGDHAAASRHLERLQTLRPRLSADTLRILATAYRATGRHDRAVECYRAAAQAEPGRADVWNDLGVALLNADAAPDSVEVLERARAIDPAMPETHLNLGNALRALGRIDEARAAYDEAARLRPGYVAPLVNRAGLKTFDSDADPDLAELVRLHAETPEQAPARARLGFALARAFDDLGDAGRAFPYLDEANALRRAAISADPAQPARAMARWAEAHAGAPGAPIEPDGGPRPVFVIGMPRSGTTLIERVLGAHPDVQALGERDEIERFVIEEAGSAEPARFWARASKARLKTLRRRYLEAMAPLAAGKAVFTDKMPGNFRFLPVLRRAFPDAVFVHCRRHPVATGLSVLQQDFRSIVPWAYGQRDIAGYYRAYDALMAAYAGSDPGAVHEVSYETVIADFEAQVRQIIDKCGLSWNDTCLEFDRSEGAVRTASAVQVRRGLNTRGLDRWRRYEPFLGPMIEALGIGSDSAGEPAPASPEQDRHGNPTGSGRTERED